MILCIPDGSIEANVFVGSNYVSLDSSSVIHLKNMSAHPFMKYTPGPVKIYELKVNITGLTHRIFLIRSLMGCLSRLQDKSCRQTKLPV